MITWENYEEYMMMHADGELQPAEVQALMAFVAQHPELKKELAAYENTILKADATQVFVNKDALLKQETVTRVIAFPQWRRYSIAAGVALLVFISLFRYMAKDNNTVELAKITETITKTIQDTTPKPAVAANIIAEENIQVKQEVNKEPVAQNKNAIAKVQKNSTYSKHNKTINVVNAPKARSYEAVASNVATAMRTAVAAITLPVAAPAPLPAASTAPAVVGMKDLSGYAVQYVDDEEEKRTFWDKLPIDEMRKGKMENIADAVAGAYRQVSATKQNIYNKSLSIKFEHKKITIGF